VFIAIVVPRANHDDEEEEGGGGGGGGGYREGSERERKRRALRYGGRRSGRRRERESARGPQRRRRGRGPRELERVEGAVSEHRRCPLSGALWKVRLVSRQPSEGDVCVRCASCVSPFRSFFPLARARYRSIVADRAEVARNMMLRWN